MTTIDNIGVPGSPMNVNPLTVWQAAVRDKLRALEAAQPPPPPPQVRVTRPNIDDRLVEVWNGTGWSVTDYDSGIRDIRVGPSWPEGLIAARLRRAHGTVSLYLRGAFPQSLNVWMVGVFPSGFLMANPRTFVVDRDVGDETLRLFVHGPDLHWHKAASSGSDISDSIEGPCSDAIPTSLPGSLWSPAPQ